MPVFAAYTLVFVHDMDRAVAFYRDALGFEVRMATPAWSELELAGAIIALHAGRDPGTRETQLGFKVLNIDSVANAVVSHGGFIHAPKKQAAGEPAIIKAGDTEGNVFFLSEGPGA
ncbi:MAG: VOC family protein [Alphaproteobacteria bacterium]|nr:VOC family protein [Alphaproteobacteria bacterium]